MRRKSTVAVLVAVMIFMGAMAVVAFGNFGGWAEAESIEDFGAGAHENFNTESAEGCPFIAPDGRRFFIASNRDGGEGGLDIWVSTRSSDADPWGEPVNLGPPINSPADDFCPTLARDGKTFYFVSTREGHCGDEANGDIYTTRFKQGMEADPVIHLGCELNSAWDEHSPFPINLPGDEHSPFPINLPGKGPSLFYSSARPANSADDPGDHDLYYSVRQASKQWKYGPGRALAEINTTAGEGQPNVSHNGKEIFFWSDRTGGEGGPDIYSATKRRPIDDWGNPVNLGTNVNGPGGETRPSLSWDGRTLYFGSDGDIYATSR